MPPLHVFDVDQTLLEVRTRPLPGWTTISAALDGHILSFHMRPDAIRFLLTMQAHSHIAIWTAGKRKYADLVGTILRNLGVVLRFVWSRDETRLVQGDYVKDLAKIKGYQRVCLWDDNPIHGVHSRASRRHVYVHVPRFCAGVSGCVWAKCSQEPAGTQLHNSMLSERLIGGKEAGTVLSPRDLYECSVSDVPADAFLKAHGPRGDVVFFKTVADGLCDSFFTRLLDKAKAV